jgi:uncharacterized protein (DUF1697 family)
MAADARVALLRAVNLGGRNLVPMAALRETLEGRGFEDVRTLLQSGNVIFRAAAPSTARLERTIEAAVAERVGVTTDAMVRTAAEWRAMVAANPLVAEARARPGQFLVTVLKRAPPAAAVTALQRAVTGGEIVAVSGRHAYLAFPAGIGRSRLTTSIIEKHLGTRGTARNWNTVLKIAAALGVAVDPR